MKSIEYLKEQVFAHKNIIKKAENIRDEYKASLDKAQYELESYVGKLEGLEYLLQLVESDFNTYPTRADSK